MNWVTVVINGKEVSVSFNDTNIHVYNAFPIKDDLKMRGYRWNPSDKSWYIQPADVNAELDILKNNLKSVNAPSLPLATDTSIDVKENLNHRHAEISYLPDSLSISDLRNHIDRLIRDGLRGNIWVRGVVASDVKHYNWASYLDLKDEDENRDIFFRVEVKKQNIQKINRKLSELGVAQGLERDLPVFCNVDVHLPFRNVVDVRLNLLDILPEYTQSRIRNQREITLEKLKEEGILENQKRLILPALMEHVGLITSGMGTSIKDIAAGLHPFNNKYRFYFVDSRMEGANAPDTVIRALDYLEYDCGIPLDAIIIARGGGSEQSLAVFNDLRICRRVCSCGLPVITAIGHEKDVSAIEMCSFLTPTPSTPSGVGKYLQNRFLLLQEQLSNSITRLIHYFTTVHQREITKISGFLKTIPTRTAGTIRMNEERFFTLARGLERAMSFTVRDHQRRLHSLSKQLLEKLKEQQIKNRKNIQNIGEQILSRSATLQQQELKRVKKSIAHLDFGKLNRDNLKNRQQLLKVSEALTGIGARILMQTQKELESQTRLVQASDPQRILEKGFTLTLDAQNRAVTSLAQFNQMEPPGATLRFHDGSIKINKEE